MVGKMSSDPEPTRLAPAQRVVRSDHLFVVTGTWPHRECHVQTGAAVGCNSGQDAAARLRD
jgi:hypothetical protein